MSLVTDIFKRRKNISKRVLEAPFLETFLENPLTHDSRASSNKKVNDRKSAQIAAGKAALAAVEGENEEPIETPAPATPRGKQAQLPTPPNSNEAATPTARGSRKRKADCRVGDARKRLGLKPASMNSG